MIWIPPTRPGFVTFENGSVTSRNWTRIETPGVKIPSLAAYAWENNSVIPYSEAIWGRPMEDFKNSCTRSRIHSSRRPFIPPVSITIKRPSATASFQNEKSCPESTQSNNPNVTPITQTLRSVIRACLIWATKASYWFRKNPARVDPDSWIKWSIMNTKEEVLRST